MRHESRLRRLISFASLLCAFACVATIASAADCPGHPDAIGTSRVLVVDPLAHPRIGAMQYKETLPLHDHEIVLTFDDGPLPKYSNQVLQILADQCAKATFFTIGLQAQANPEGVRKLAAAGHTIGTHSQTHPLNFNKMTIDQAKPQVDQGIASTSAALTDPSVLAPFFRVPGLLHGDAVETYAASLGIQVWSADFLADDWRNISSSRVYDLAIKRIEARHRGILLLHDIHARTVAALPRLLSELRRRGYHIVQVVPATANRPATPTEPQDWQVHRPSDRVPTAQWPTIPTFDFSGSRTLRGLTSADFALISDQQFLWRDVFANGPRAAPWPNTVNLPLIAGTAVLPAPAPDLFVMPEGMSTAARSTPLPVRLTRPEDVPIRGAKKPAKTTAKIKTMKHVAAAAKPGKHPVHVASLKKRG